MTNSLANSHWHGALQQIFLHLWDRMPAEMKNARGESGISVVSSAGELVEFVATPDVFTTNICWGGADMMTAYVTLSGTGQLATPDVLGAVREDQRDRTDEARGPSFGRHIGQLAEQQLEVEAEGELS